MICKIGAKRSNDPGALIAYLFGPGKANEHVNPRTVAGSAHYPGAGKTAAPQVTADLRAIQRLWPDVKFPGGHVWHCSLSLGADEGVLPDSKWAAIADDFMQRMDFTGSGRSPVRWTAVHHGPSEAGNDHVHLVVNLVREDGTKVNIWRDMVRSQKVLQELEQQHGLSVLQSRAAGVRSVPYTAAEVARSRATGKPIERVELERIVRASAAAAPDEAAFVRLLRGSGVTVRPYPPQGAVTGYSVGLPPPADLPPRFFQGGELARDLTLPKLRANWSSSPVSTSVAEVAWRHGGPAVPVARPAVVASGIPVAPDALARALDDLRPARSGSAHSNAGPARRAVA